MDDEATWLLILEDIGFDYPGVGGPCLNIRLRQSQYYINPILLNMSPEADAV
jgi:hypothetical protein